MESKRSLHSQGSFRQAAQASIPSEVPDNGAGSIQTRHKEGTHGAGQG